MESTEQETRPVEATQSAIAEILADGWETPAQAARRAFAEGRREQDPEAEIQPEHEVFAFPSGEGWVLHGHFGGVTYQKATQRVKADTPSSPNDPIAAARWLDAHARRNMAPPMLDLTTEATLTPPEAAIVQEPDMAQPININVAPVFNVTGGNATSATDSTGDGVANPLHPPQAMHPSEAAAIAEVEGLFPAGEAEYGGEHETYGETGEKAAEDIHEPAWVYDEAGGHAESVFSGAEAGPVAYDADFEAFGEPEALDAEAAAEPLALPEGLELGEDIVAAEDEAAPSVAYFGDNIHTIRLAKMGRLSQRARELKATLQQGWTLERFAYLQNLIVRIDRKEAPDDDAARAEFLAINERSAAMARVDAYRELREAELEAADRAGVEAFDPEAGWP